MTDYIERDVWKSLPDDLPYKASVKRVLMQAPAADVRPVVRGRWIGAGEGCCMCSECNQKVSIQFSELVNFCPNCGAEMVITFEGCVPLDNAKPEDADFSLADRIREENE